MAGVKVGDLDVLSLYDPNSFEIMRQLEMLGICGEGESGPFVETGAIALDGTYPVNPDGGLLSHSWNRLAQQGLKIVEGVRQLRGDACHQVPGAEVAFVTNAGAGAQHIEIMVLGRG
jgi:acetyl-CoA acetyltransferase